MGMPGIDIQHVIDRLSARLAEALTAQAIAEAQVEACRAFIAELERGGEDPGRAQVVTTQGWVDKS